MPIEKTFRQLSELICELHDHLLALQLTVREDTPAHGAVVLVDKFGDAVDDLLGWVQEALGAAFEAQRTLAAPANWESARKYLAVAQEQVNRAQQSFQSELVSYERLKDLTAFGRSRRGEWSVWVKTVRDGLDRCRAPLEQASRCLLECWQEIAERGAMNSVYVHSTNIGQQIAASESEETVRRGIT